MYSKQLADQWKELIVGQDHAIDKIVPYIVRYKAGLNSTSRPIGNFFLLGPTGTGKTRTAESLAEVLHSDERKILKVDCAEFNLEHETSKLVGAPPGYLGHKDTQPLLSQNRINGVASTNCDISIVLFDEIEKANPAFWRLLLGVLDKATLRLGDNNTVSFEKAIIFMSSNVGAKEMYDSVYQSFGFSKPVDDPALNRSFEKIGAVQMGKKFPPEFPNRLDETITYHMLDEVSLTAITSLEIKKVQNQILNRLGVRTFHLVYGKDVIDFFTHEGTSTKYGAREIKRTITRHLWNPLSDQFVDEKIKPGCHVYCRVENDKIIWDVKSPQFVIGDDGKITYNDVEVVNGVCSMCKQIPGGCNNRQGCPYEKA
jgi:ATP-dependent Clp protease ATP-binding subunit ClpA